MAQGTSLWLADAGTVTDADLQRYLAWLTPGEQARHARFVRSERRRQFVAGRVLLRMALGPVLGVPPRQVLLEERRGLSPRLVTAAPVGVAPGFSIAHSGPWLACAVSGLGAVGLDIEMMDPSRDLAALARQAFEGDAAARWQAMQGWLEAERVAGFYRLWSEQEARFKLGLEQGGYCIAVPHAELSVVLCSAAELPYLPQLQVVALP